MAKTSLGFVYPTSADDVRPYEDIQFLADSLNTFLNLPADVTATATSSTITSTSYAAPTNPLQAIITNPSSTYDMIVDVVIAAWLANDTANELTVTFAASGGLTIAAGSNGAGGPLANGEILLSRGAITATAQQMTVPIRIPAGAAAVTVAVQAKRSTASGTQSFNLPALRLRPRRFLVP